MDHPTRGQQRCMIYAYHRQLPDGCDNCGRSAVFCAASKSMNSEPCCTACSGHG